VDDTDLYLRNGSERTVTLCVKADMKGSISLLPVLLAIQAPSQLLDPFLWFPVPFWLLRLGGMTRMKPMIAQTIPDTPVWKLSSTFAAEP
jgi:hypothetical protein